MENGDAVGICRRAGFEPDILLESERHQAIAKEAALNRLKEDGAEFWTTFDDDDYYGEEYLTELSDASGRAELIGKDSIFVKTLDDKLRLFGASQNKYVEAVHGPTISAWVSESEHFYNVGKWSEDTCFCDQMKSKGARIWATSQWNFINQRHLGHNHTWVITDRQMAQGWLYTAKNAFINEYPLDIDCVTNKKLPKPVKIKKDPYVLEDSAAYTYARKEAGSMEDWVERVMNGK